MKRKSKQPVKRKNARKATYKELVRIVSILRNDVLRLKKELGEAYSEIEAMEISHIREMQEMEEYF